MAQQGGGGYDISGSTSQTTSSGAKQSIGQIAFGPVNVGANPVLGGFSTKTLVIIGLVVLGAGLLAWKFLKKKS